MQQRSDHEDNVHHFFTTTALFLTLVASSLNNVQSRRTRHAGGTPEEGQGRAELPRSCSLASGYEPEQGAAEPDHACAHGTNPKGILNAIY